MSDLRNDHPNGSTPIGFRHESAVASTLEGIALEAGVRSDHAGPVRHGIFGRISGFAVRLRSAFAGW